MLAIGERTGRLTILETWIEKRDKNSLRMYRVRCDCGTVKTVSAPSLYRTISCGCYMREKNSAKMSEYYEYQGKKYSTKEILQLLKRLYKNQLTELTLQGYLRVQGLEKTIALASGFQKHKRASQIVPGAFGYSSIGALATALGISRQRLYQKLKAGQRLYQVNGKILWTTSEKSDSNKP